jgi:hypothetical protein
MTDTTTNTPEAPKKSNKKMLAIVSLILVLVFGTNHLFFKVGYTTVEVAVTDSTIVVTPMMDTTVVPAVDTTKKDTAK